MSLTLGPMTGVSDTTAHVWIKGTPSDKYVIRFASGLSPARTVDLITQEDGIGVAKLTGLSSNSAYTYDVLQNDGTGAFLGGRFATFPTPGTDVEFSFGFFSCHRPVETNSMIMWDRLSDLTHQASQIDQLDSMRFLLGIGDQIYADQPFFGEDSTEYTRMTDLEEIELYFHDIYNEFWKLGPVRNSLSRCPSYMMWDDHDIRDGWGSDPSDRPAAKPFFGVAETAYIRHQALHNPFVSDPTRRKYYSFIFGKVGFIILDLRGERIRADQQMMSASQWLWLENTLKEYCAGCDTVFVACSVPYLHLRWTIKQILGTIKPKEIMDLWNSDHWKAEGQRFARLLFGTMKQQRHARIYLLGGDVHVATAGAVYSEAHGDVPSIPQFTSSGISNTPTWLNTLVTSTDKFAMFGHSSPYKGVLPHAIARRNFGVVNYRRDTDNRYRVQFDIHYEGGDEPKTLYNGGAKGGTTKIG